MTHGTKVSHIGLANEEDKIKIFESVRGFEINWVLANDKHRCGLLIFKYLDLEVREVLSGELVCEGLQGSRGCSNQLLPVIFMCRLSQLHNIHLVSSQINQKFLFRISLCCLFVLILYTSFFFCPAPVTTASIILSYKIP